MPAFAVFGLSMTLAMSAASADTMKVKVNNKSGIAIIANSTDEVVTIDDGDKQVVSWTVTDCTDLNQGVVIFDSASQATIVAVYYKLDKDNGSCKLKYNGNENKWYADYDQTYKVEDESMSDEHERELIFETK